MQQMKTGASFFNATRRGRKIWLLSGPLTRGMAVTAA